jgi:hypothetical protein
MLTDVAGEVIIVERQIDHFREQRKRLSRENDGTISQMLKYGASQCWQCREYYKGIETSYTTRLVQNGRRVFTCSKQCAEDVNG